MARFTNPWADSEGFIPLGEYCEITRERLTYYDLYALVSHTGTDLHEISLGARYSNDGPDYISGSLDTGWQYGSSKPMAEAARRFVRYLLREGV